MALSPGARLDPYEVTALIDSGGMGEVYRARDTKLTQRPTVPRRGQKVGMGGPEAAHCAMKHARACRAAILVILLSVAIASCGGGRSSRPTVPSVVPPPLHTPEDGTIVGQYYVNEKKGFRVAVPPPEWRPTFLREDPAQVADITFRRAGGWTFAAGFLVPRSFRFQDVNAWWVQTISTKWGWTDIKIIEEKELKIGGFDARLVTFEFTSGGSRQVDMTYNIRVPGGEYNLYRIRMTSAKDLFDYFLPDYEKFVRSFSFLFSPPILEREG